MAHNPQGDIAYLFHLSDRRPVHTGVLQDGSQDLAKVAEHASQWRIMREAGKKHETAVEATGGGVPAGELCSDCCLATPRKGV